ncbi:MAG: hypothetical protein WCT42_01510 [Candidatus Paceibacterota bacterium]|jgi:hypothetical protein
MSTKSAFLFISNQQFQNRNDWEAHKKNVTGKFKDRAVHAHHHKMDSAKNFAEISQYEEIIVVFDECPHATIKTRKTKIERSAPGKTILFYSKNSDSNHAVKGVTQINGIHELLPVPGQMQ